MRNFTAKITFIAFLTVSLVLVGCGHYSGEPVTNLPAGDGSPDDPMAAHLAARRQVNPKELNGPHRYTTTPTAEEVDEEAAEVRIAALEGKLGDFKKTAPAPQIEKPIMAYPLRDHPQDGGPVVKPAMKPVIISPRPEFAPRPPKIAAVANATSSAASTVTGVRVGEHPDKTRIVLDVNAPAKFSYTLDSGGKFLVVRLPESSWAGPGQDTLANSAMIKSYVARPSPSGGVDLTIEFRKPARLTMSSALGPNDTYGDRIVFDVAPL